MNVDVSELVTTVQAVDTSEAPCNRRLDAFYFVVSTLFGYALFKEGNFNGLRHGGSDGDDELFWGQGKDNLKDGEGSDTLDDGQGSDVLRGGKGANTFSFIATEENSFGDDVIEDYSAADGLIEVTVEDQDLVSLLRDGDGNIVIQSPDGTVTLQGSAELSFGDVSLTTFKLYDLYRLSFDL